MWIHERLSARLPAVREAATSFLSVAGVGVVSDDGPDQRFLTWADRRSLVTRRVGSGELAVAAGIAADSGQLIAVPLPGAAPASSLLALVEDTGAVPAAHL